MNADSQPVKSEFETNGADIDTKLAELLGDTVDPENEPMGNQSNDGPATVAHDEVADGTKPWQPPGADTSGVGAESKRSSRGRSVARLERRVDDAVRSIVDNYEFATEAPLYGSIAVVSALPGEGVTTIADGLARVLARDFDTKVCVIDTHTACPDKGIYEVLSEDVTLDDVLIDEGDGIFRLALGQVPASARNSWIRLPEWSELIKELTEEFGHCIFDTPPMLSRSHTLTLLRHVGAHVLVTRFGSTSATQVKAVADQLGNHPRLGSVLNGYTTKTPRFIRRYFSE